MAIRRKRHSKRLGITTATKLQLSRGDNGYKEKWGSNVRGRIVTRLVRHLSEGDSGHSDTKAVSEATKNEPHEPEGRG